MRPLNSLCWTALLPLSWPLQSLKVQALTFNGETVSFGYSAMTVSFTEAGAISTSVTFEVRVVLYFLAL